MLNNTFVGQSFFKVYDVIFLIFSSGIEVTIKIICENVENASLQLHFFISLYVFIYIFTKIKITYKSSSGRFALNNPKWLLKFFKSLELLTNSNS